MLELRVLSTVQPAVKLRRLKGIRFIIAKVCANNYRKILLVRLKGLGVKDKD